MDPWALLGVDRGAPAAERRAAHRRLRAQVRADAGGSAGLERLVDGAYDATSGRPGPKLDVDPHALLGLATGARREDIRAAYRRVAVRVHPDRGGTDELFRVVATAADLLLTPGGRRSRIRYPPPPSPPPPPGPFQPKPPDHRLYEPAWRTWLDVGGSLGVLAPMVLVAGVLLVGLAGARDPRNTFPLMLLVVAVFLMAARAPVRGVTRAVIRLHARRRRVAAESVDRFLSACCLDAPVARERADLLYAAYRHWCRKHRSDPVSTWRFVEYLRSLGVLYVNSSSWEAGVWVGIRLRDDVASATG